MSMAGTRIAAPRCLPAYGLFAAMLAAAGLPIYIHAPKFYVDSYGVSLSALGAVLFALRLLDVIQDPLLGRLAESLRGRRGAAVAAALALIAAAMAGLFAVTPRFDPLLWFALMLMLMFSAFSFLTICFYAQGVSTAGELGPAGHIRLARWRETGALLGVCAAAVAPALLVGLSALPFAGYALGFAILVLLAGRAMRAEWTGAAAADRGSLRDILHDRIARRLLLIAGLNAAPVAVSATLFLFFVESRLAAPGSEGWLLVLFFLSAAAAAPFWSMAAERQGAKPVLMAGMSLSILAFSMALFLGPGDVAAFAVICIASGAALGADMTLLPALFAARLARVSPGAAAGFGLWSFMSKLTLALAAVMLLPALDRAGFRAGGASSPEALRLLTLFYAGLPCLLKLAALWMLAATKLKES